MRHTYELSQETRITLAGNVTDIAAEMNVLDKYLYAILAGTQTDPFAKFEHLYAAVRRAGGRTCHWRRKLDAIDARYDKQMPGKPVVDCLTDKIHADANSTQEFVAALSDGQIDEYEAARLQVAIDKERSTLDLLERHVQLRRVREAA